MLVIEAVTCCHRVERQPSEPLVQIVRHTLKRAAHRRLTDVHQSVLYMPGREEDDQKRTAGGLPHARLQPKPL